jgi:hypothetical protein
VNKPRATDGLLCFGRLLRHAGDLVRPQGYAEVSGGTTATPLARSKHAIADQSNQSQAVALFLLGLGSSHLISEAWQHDNRLEILNPFQAALRGILEWVARNALVIL